MMEKEPQNNVDEGKVSVDYIRHSIANYKTYKSVLNSDNPLQAFDKNKQEKNDLTEAGIDLAEREARQYFEQLNPKSDKLFFTSSNEARAMETANIYRKIAKSMGFKIIKPDQSLSRLSDEIAEGEIRALNTLSINYKNTLLEDVFNPSNRRGGVDWSKVPRGVREKFDQAVAIVDSDNQGSWGANFAKHSEAIKSIIPEIETAKEQFEHKFKSLLKLLKLGQKIFQDANTEGNLKVLAFGHENMIIHFIQNRFMEEGLKNCEVVDFVPEEDGVNFSFKDKSVNL